MLCDVSGQGEWDTIVKAPYCYGQGDEWQHCTLPPFMEKFTGLTSNTENTLLNMNDRSELSFNEIADWIEENIEEG